MSQGAEEIGATLPEDPGNRARVGGELQFAVACVGNVNPHRKGSWQVPANDDRQRLFTAAPRLPFGKGRVGGEDVLERRHRIVAADEQPVFGTGATGKGRGAPN